MQSRRPSIHSGFPSGLIPPMSTMMGSVIEFPNRQTQSASPQDAPTPHERAENRGDLGGIASKPRKGMRLSWGGSANRTQAKGVHVGPAVGIAYECKHRIEGKFAGVSPEVVM